MGEALFKGPNNKIFSIGLSQFKIGYRAIVKEIGAKEDAFFIPSEGSMPSQELIEKLITLGYMVQSLLDEK